jgi:dsRNA-specific ribonuclease
MEKNVLQEYTQKAKLDLPVYETVIAEDEDNGDHVLRFRSRVSVGRQSYSTTSWHTTKTAAEQAAARVAVQELQLQPSRLVHLVF